ncbi:cell wall-binding repeat-containing protein [Sporomusa malonica]|uniref:Putative cell wall binding repeat 2 n=1 Tax=Sporomusa malonica TaxID=112901 RepID=A0A1W1Z6C9_9FIRM|nr:cell wall-binding repeat-containing protein [Sporomusa malonica]SMC43862.1 Putative cell wall binding repeat 2 [Sporomusa malonica]
MFPLNTVDTTRIPYDTAVDLSVTVSRMQWPKPDMEKAPKVIILVPDEHFPYAFAATSLVHDPIMGNLLFTPVNELASPTRQEIERLDPPGTNSVPPIIAVGPFAAQVIREIESMGYDVLHITGKNVFATAVKVAKLREQLTPESPEGPVSLFILSADNPYEGILATYYATHSGVPILLTHKDRLPRATATALQDMADKNVYIVGSKHSVSDSVAREISSIVEPPVRRIAGEDPFETSVEFSTYYDPATKLGWNRNRKGLGDAFTFGNITRWDLILAASAMAHQGKHTPLLLVEADCAPPVVLNYLQYLKPPLRMPPMPPFMHGFILGTPKIIGLTTQADIEEALKIDEQPEKKQAMHPDPDTWREETAPPEEQ